MKTLKALSFASVLLFACKGEAATDVKQLYSVEASAAPVNAGGTGTLHLAVKPKAGAHVKAETPFRAKLEATGPVALQKTELKYADHVRVENEGPVFEVPFEAKSAGKGEIKADMTFFVCTAESCNRTTEQVTVPVQVN